MDMTLGRRIAELRKKQNLTQEDLAGKLNLSAQAVSKWEHDLSCPDISVLVELADILGVSCDQLLRGDGAPETRLAPEAVRKPLEQMLLRIVVNSADGDKVRVNLPLTIVQAGVDMGMSMGLMGDKGEALKSVDFAQILSMANMGVIGKMIEVESADGDSVELWIE